MPSTPIHTNQTPELPTAIKSTRDCGIPGCFTCANGEEHPPKLTASDEFLLSMRVHSDALREAIADVESRMWTLNIERKETDLESGHDELRELEIVRYDLINAQNSVGNYNANAETRAVLQGGSQSERPVQEVMNEEAFDRLFELTDTQGDALDTLASEYDPSHANFLASKLEALLVNFEAEEERDALPTRI